jgi:hypothetical protein
MMKILTLFEPWATLMSISAKRIETRPWRTPYRGHLAIHSAKGGLSKSEFLKLCENPIFYNALCESSFFAREVCGDWRDLYGCFPRGCIVGVVNLVDCLPTVSDVCRSGVFEDYPDLDTPRERAFGNYEEGRYGWVTEKAFLLPDPVPFKGSQGLRDLPPKTRDQIWEQLASEEAK